MIMATSELGLFPHDFDAEVLMRAQNFSPVIKWNKVVHQLIEEAVLLAEFEQVIRIYSVLLRV